MQHDSRYATDPHATPLPEGARSSVDVVLDVQPEAPEIEPAPPEQWPKLHEKALHGLAGDVVDWLQARLPEWDGYSPIPEAERERLRLELEKTIKAHARPVSEAEAEAWPEPEPLPVGMPPVEPFTFELLPEALRPWVQDIAERMQCPPDYPAVGAIVCLSAVVGRQIGIRPKRRDDWTVTPNLWGAVVGRPSLLKSPALAEPMKLLQQLEVAARAAHEEAAQEHQAKQMVAEAQVKQTKAKIAEEVKKKKGDALTLALNHIQAEPDEEPRRRRYVSNDGTIEKLGELLRDNPRGILNFRDELSGWLQSLDREGREGTRAFFLECWNGTGPFTFDRIGRGTVEIEAACLSVLGGIQPGPLSTYLFGVLNGGTGDDGLLQRLQLLVWPDAPKKWRNVDRWPDTEAKQAAWATFERLDTLDPAAIGAQQDEGDPIPWLRFDDAAQGEFNTWRADLEARLREDDMPPALESHLAKYRSLVPSLALLIHLADHPEGGPVNHDALLQACGWAEYLETHARRLYSQVLEPGLAAALELDRRLSELPEPFTARDVYRKHWRLLDREGAAAALAVLVDYGRIRGKRIAGPGRQTEQFRVNPALKAR